MVSIQQAKSSEKTRREFSLKQLSSTERTVVYAIHNSNHAPHAYEIFLNIFTDNYEDFKFLVGSPEYHKAEIEEMKLKPPFPIFEKMNVKEDWAEVLKHIENKKFESAARVMRKYGYEVPTYQTVVRTLNSLLSDGWVERKLIAPSKKGMVWFLSPSIEHRFEQQKREQEKKLIRERKLALEEAKAGKFIPGFFPKR